MYRPKYRVVTAKGVTMAAFDTWDAAMRYDTLLNAAQPATPPLFRVAPPVRTPNRYRRTK